jgi:hypothetical protein
MTNPLGIAQIYHPDRDIPIGTDEIEAFSATS